jgi:hypothetical protein
VVIGLDDVKVRVDVVLDNVGGQHLVTAWNLLKPGGILQSIGWASGEPAVFPPNSIFAHGPAKTIESFGDASHPGPDLSTLVNLAASGAIAAGGVARFVDPPRRRDRRAAGSTCQREGCYRPRRGAAVMGAPYPDAKLPIVHPGDIASCAAAVLLSPTPITGVFSITGPEKLSLRDQTAVLSDVLGTDLRVEQISEDEAVKVGFPQGTPEFVTSSVLGTLGPAATVLEVSGDVQMLTGHAPRTFADWARENAQAVK